MKKNILWMSLLFPCFAMGAPDPTAAQEDDPFVIDGSLSKLNEGFHEHVIVPGFIATRQQETIATITGPVRSFTSYLISDRVYLNWVGSPAPRVGDFYSIYTPAVVLQNKYNSSEYQVILDKGQDLKVPERWRIAGYLYEPNGELKILEVNRGVVKAIVTHAQKQINLGDKIMLPMPQFDNIEPITGGMQMSATVVAGSPPERISPTIGSYVYINRGSRDGVKIGRIFEVSETVQLVDNPIVAPTESMGEMKVVYTTEFFSTALVTKQFNVMRIGGVVQTKTGDRPIHNKMEKFQVHQRRGVPTQLEGAIEKPLTPKQKLSELDELERRAGVLGLTPEERKRLETLQRQDLRKSEPESEQQEGEPGASNEVPSLPSAPKGSTDSKVATGKKPEPVKKKKKPSGQDEANLNELMQF